MLTVRFVEAMSWARAFGIGDRAACHRDGCLIRFLLGSFDPSNDLIAVLLDVADTVLSEVKLPALPARLSEFPLNLRIKKHASNFLQNPNISARRARQYSRIYRDWRRFLVVEI